MAIYYPLAMAKRLLIFILIASAIAFYLALRLSTGLREPYTWIIRAIIAVLVLLIFIFPLSWRERKNPQPPSAFSKMLKLAIFMDMGFLSFLGALTVARDIFLLPVAWFRPDLQSTLFGVEASLTLFALAALMLAFGVWQAARPPRIKKVYLPIKGLPPELEGYTIAQISDLHLSLPVSLEKVKRVVDLTNSLEPDLIVLTGDIGDGATKLLGPLIEAMRGLGGKKQAPKLYITGNHEYYWNAPEWIRAFEGVGMKALLNSREILQHKNSKILVGGVTDPAARMIDPSSKPDLAKAMGTPEAGISVRILLAHQPGIAHDAEAHGFDVQLSGHTHAGQFFPWTLVVGRVHEFSNGLGECGRMWVYVNPGTGSWGPQIRLGSRTEITKLILKRLKA